jgi:hypothetical protein
MVECETDPWLRSYFCDRICGALALGWIGASVTKISTSR